MFRNFLVVIVAIWVLTQVARAGQLVEKKDCQQQMTKYTEEINRHMAALPQLTAKADEARKNPDSKVNCDTAADSGLCEKNRAQIRKPIEAHAEAMHDLAQLIESQKRTAIRCVRELTATLMQPTPEDEERVKHPELSSDPGRKVGSSDTDRAPAAH